MLGPAFCETNQMAVFELLVAWKSETVSLLQSRRATRSPTKAEMKKELP